MGRTLFCLSPHKYTIPFFVSSKFWGYLTPLLCKCLEFDTATSLHYCVQNLSFPVVGNRLSKFFLKLLYTIMIDK
jgi:hypothetical protein